MIHHLAIASKDFRRAHDFYVDAMGFRLAKVVKRIAPGDRGWTRHVFYDVGDGTLFALWDLHLTDLDADAWRAGISSGLGLPVWINHVAFDCGGPEALEEHKARWLDHGLVVSEVHHEFIHSIYTTDPDGTVVEWTYATRALGELDLIEAELLLADDSPATEPDYEAVVHRPAHRAVRT